MDNMDNSRSFERNDDLGDDTSQMVEDFRASTERPQVFQQRTYQVSHHQGFMEQALPSQYHATMKVASKIPPTSLRGIQHASQKTEQSTRLINSYSTYKRENLGQEMIDEDLDPILDNDQGLAENLETIETDIFEIEEIKFCNLTKRITDTVNGAKSNILYSREIPSKSMEIHGIPFNKSKSSDSIKWLRCRISQGQETLLIQIQSNLNENDPDFLYEVEINKESYLNLQKQQSIHTSFQEFGKRLATLLDYCILQLHSSSDLKSRFTCVLNEDEQDSDKQTLYICEQNEFRHLVHLQLNFTRVEPINRAEFYHTENRISNELFQNYLKQKMVLIQKNRESCQAMLEINGSLKLLKDENQRTIEEARLKNIQDLGNLERTKSDEMAAIIDQHNRERMEIQRSKDLEIEQLRQENASLNQRLNTAQSNYEKEQLTKDHVAKELQDLTIRVQQYLQEIQELREKVEVQTQSISMLEKDKLQLTLENERKDSQIDGIEANLKDLKEKYLSESAELQQLKLDHTKLQQVSQSQNENIEQLKIQIDQGAEVLESQKKETEKYKDKKLHFKDSFKESQDGNTRLQAQISDLERRLTESESVVQERDQTISQKEGVLEVLQAKLKETQTTLLSNNTTIEELKTSLAEAQKSSAHHPPAPPISSYQGQFQNQNTTSANASQSLSQFLKTNDPRVASNSPYRVPQNEEPLMMQQQTSAAASRLQESYVQVQNSVAIQSQGYQLQESIRKTQVDNIGQEQQTMYSGAKQVRIPLTDYYANKFGGGQDSQSLRQSRPLYKPDQAPHVESLGGNENSVMLMAQQQMQRRQVPMVHDLYGGSSYKKPWNDQSYPRDSGNQYAQQLERDKIATEEKLKQTMDSQQLVNQNYGIPPYVHQELERNESRQSAMFGNNANSGDLRRSSVNSGGNEANAMSNLNKNSGLASQASFRQQNVIVDINKIEKELEQTSQN